VSAPGPSRRAASVGAGPAAAADSPLHRPMRCQYKAAPAPPRAPGDETCTEIACRPGTALWVWRPQWGAAPERAAPCTHSKFRGSPAPGRLPARPGGRPLRAAREGNVAAEGAPGAGPRMTLPPFCLTLRAECMSAWSRAFIWACSQPEPFILPLCYSSRPLCRAAAEVVLAWRDEAWADVEILCGPEAGQRHDRAAWPEACQARQRGLSRVSRTPPTFICSVKFLTPPFARRQVQRSMGVGRSEVALPFMFPSRPMRLRHSF
jgi:hypothetical protein